MKKALPYLYLTVNFGCALAVLLVAHRIASLMRLEQRTESDSVDGITFFFDTAPAFLLASLSTLGWIIKALVDAFRGRGFRAFGWLAPAAAFWVASVLIARHL